MFNADTQTNTVRTFLFKKRYSITKQLKTIPSNILDVTLLKCNWKFVYYSLTVIYVIILDVCGDIL